jgi:hypothetical protein
MKEHADHDLRAGQSGVIGCEMNQVALERGGLGLVDPMFGRSVDVNLDQLLLLAPVRYLAKLAELEVVAFERARKRLVRYSIAK